MRRESVQSRINMLEKYPSTLGTSEGPEKLRLDTASDPDYLIRLARIGKITKAIKFIGLPRLQQQIQEPKEQEPVTTDSGPGEDKRGSQRFEIPEGKGVTTRAAKFLSIISGFSEQQPISRDEILQRLGTESDNPKDAIKNLSRAIAEARSVVESTPYEVGVVLGDRSKREPASYYLKGMEQNTDTSTEPTGIETLSLIEMREFGILSRLDISIIARNFQYNQVKINEYLDSKGVKSLDSEVLERLVGLTGNISIIPSNVTEPQERSARILEMRNKAKGKIKELLLDPNFEAITDEICEKDEDVWELLVHLYELNEHLSISSGTQGISSFFERLVLDPTTRRAVIDVRSGSVMGIVYKEGIPETKEVQSKPPVIITDESVIAEHSTLEKTEEREVEFDRQWAELLKQDKGANKVANNQEKEESTESSAILKPEDQSVKVKSFDVEERDSEVRTKLRGYLVDILSHPHLHKSVYRMGLKAVYPRLNAKFIEEMIKNKWLRVPYDREKGPRLDPVADATILYLNDYSGNLTGKMRKKIQKIAEEVFEEALEEYKKHHQSSK